MSDKVIGILAGMGPRSTAPFIDLVIDECQIQYGAKYDEEYPKMMIYSLPTPFYIDRPIDHDVMEKTIIKGLQKLESIGVDFIAMPCNSAHVYYEDLIKSVNIPLLNFIEETVKELPKASQKVTLFSTNTTLKSNIYQRGILDANHEFIFQDDWQLKLNRLIQSIKINKDDINNVVMWNELIEDVKKEAIGNIIIACTDLNVVLKENLPTLRIIDSSRSLAKSVVDTYLEFIRK